LRGFRHLAYFGFRRSVDAKREQAGMREMAREHGYPCAGYSTHPGFAEQADKWARFVAYIKRVQDGWEVPLGVLFQADELCHAVATISRCSGWQIPEQLALMGVGNEPSICNTAVPTLSSIDRNDRRVGYEAARLLDAGMRGEKPPAEPLMIPPKEVVVRGSTDCHAVSDPRVARALSHMARQSTTKLSVPEIASFVGVGRQTLERAFQEHLGRTVNEELIRLRVTHLQRLLLDSDTSVKEISTRVGFGTTANMFPLFKRLTGMTPIKYREKHGLPSSL
jgi:LacI family transcriptional regulator